jgi:hypothetical protein
MFMIVGSLLLVSVFPILAYTRIPAVIPMAIMGIAFSLVPSVLWMSVVFVVDRSKLGFASAVVDAIQQLGLVAANLLIGWSNDRWLAGATNPVGYRPSMWIFTAFAACSLLVALALRRVETGPYAQGLETIRAQIT